MPLGMTFAEFRRNHVAMHRGAQMLSLALAMQMHKRKRQGLTCDPRSPVARMIRGRRFGTEQALNNCFVLWGRWPCFITPAIRVNA
jgi:hypothetical protein